MFLKPCLFLVLLAGFHQVSARFKSQEPEFIENVINSEVAAVSSSSSRIVSGWEAKPGQHPHHAALRFVNAVGGMRKCGGSIVSQEWVITAAFCTISRILAIVRAGGVSLTHPEYVFETTEWYNEPRFNNHTTALQQHDISLLKLQRPLVYSRLVRPIRVQSSADAFRDYAGEQVYASGNGRTSTSGPTSDVLLWVYLRAVSNTACRSSYTTGVFDTTICAQFYNVTSQATCFQDNGGPLVHVGSDGIPTLIGVSYFFSDGGCQTIRPAGFTRPGPYLQWFKQVTGIDFENLQEGDEDGTTTTEATTTTDSTTNDPTTNDPTTNNPTTTAITTDSGEQEPDENTSSPPPEDSEEDGEDSDSNEGDMVQLLKRLEVNVKVKVAINKYNVTQNVGKEIDVQKH